MGIEKKNGITKEQAVKLANIAQTLHDIKNVTAVKSK